MTKKALAGIVTLVAAAVIFGIVVGGWYLGTRNRLVTLDEGINAAWSEIDNQLKRRSDLIPNLVATVKGFARQELQVFGEIADARARLSGARSVGEAAQGYNQLQSALGRLLVIVENYPELKSSENFTRLQDELAGTENRIAVARKRYNDSVREFNTRIRRYPASAVAGRLGFESREYFQIEERAREAPEVDFEKQRNGA